MDKKHTSIPGKYILLNKNNLLFSGKKYNFIDVLAMLCMCLGLMFFVLADNSASPNFNSHGNYHIYNLKNSYSEERKYILAFYLKRSTLEFLVR